MVGEGGALEGAGRRARKRQPRHEAERRGRSRVVSTWGGGLSPLATHTPSEDLSLGPSCLRAVPRPELPPGNLPQPRLSAESRPHRQHRGADGAEQQPEPPPSARAGAMHASRQRRRPAPRMRIPNAPPVGEVESKYDSARAGAVRSGRSREGRAQGPSALRRRTSCGVPPGVARSGGCAPGERSSLASGRSRSAGAASPTAGGGAGQRTALAAGRRPVQGRQTWQRVRNPEPALCFSWSNSVTLTCDVKCDSLVILSTRRIGAE